MDDDLVPPVTASMADPPLLKKALNVVGQRYQKVLDDLTPRVQVRWAIFVTLLLLFGIRIYHAKGWFIVTYALGIYLLNLFIGFLTPRFDPAPVAMDDDGGPSLPTTTGDEFKPFVRRLPEFKFWHAACKATIFAFICTFFQAFNIPVFWPILVVYFIVLFTITMRRQIQHMIKYKYVPFDVGKQRYSGKAGSAAEQ